MSQWSPEEELLTGHMSSSLRAPWEPAMRAAPPDVGRAHGRGPVPGVLCGGVARRSAFTPGGCGAPRSQQPRLPGHVLILLRARGPPLAPDVTSISWPCGGRQLQRDLKEDAASGSRRHGHRSRSWSSGASDRGTSYRPQGSQKSGGRKSGGRHSPAWGYRLGALELVLV